MTDDSLETEKEMVSFHPCTTPRGMTWYDLNVLTQIQQKQLNELKIETIREDNRYLAKHPEIRAIIALFLREVLREQPVTKTLALYAKNFFMRPKTELQHEIDKYLKERGEPLKKEGDSAVNLHVDLSRPSTPSDLLYQQNVFSYLSYTDEPSGESTAGEWSSSMEGGGSGVPPPGSAASGIFDLPAYLSDIAAESVATLDNIVMPSYTYDRDFDMLFSSRLTLQSGMEVDYSVEESTVNLAKYVLSQNEIHEGYEEWQESHVVPSINDINLVSEETASENVHQILKDLIENIPNSDNNVI